MCPLPPNVLIKGKKKKGIFCSNNKHLMIYFKIQFCSLNKISAYQWKQI